MRESLYRRMNVLAINEMEKAADNGLPFDNSLPDRVIGRVFGTHDYFYKDEIDEIIIRFKELQRKYNKLICECDSDLVLSKDLQHCRSSLSLSITTLENIRNRMR